MDNGNTKTRVCTKCKIEKLATEQHFDYQNRARGWFTSTCRFCRRAYVKQRNRQDYVPKPKRVNSNDLLTRTCVTCKQELPQNEMFFRLKVQKKHKLYYYQCRDCEIKFKRQRRADNTDGYIKELVASKRRHHAKVANNPKLRKAAALRTREWYRNNKDRAIQTVRRRERNLIGSYTGAELQARYDEQRGLCYWCGIDISTGFERDHVIPLSKGGVNEISNIVCACKSCNRSKSDSLPKDWIERLNKQ